MNKKSMIFFVMLREDIYTVTCHPERRPMIVSAPVSSITGTRAGATHLI